mgnify:CR=1 FL=1
MARGVNKVIIVGTLGNDPEVKYSASGSAIANLSVATSEQWKDKQTGEKKEQTEWHRVVIFGKLAEVAGEYLRKGSQVYIEGQLRTRKWTDQSGQDRYTTEVVVNVGGTMQMLGGRQGGGAPAGGNIGGSQPQGGWGQPQQPAISSAAARSLARSSPLRQRRLTSRRWTLMTIFRFDDKTNPAEAGFFICLLEFLL